MLAVRASKGRLMVLGVMVELWGTGRKEMRVPMSAGMNRAGRAQWPKVFQKASCCKVARGRYGIARADLFLDEVGENGS